MMFGTIGLAIPSAVTGMPRIRPGLDWSERQKLLVGSVALLLGALSVWILGTNGLTDTAAAMALGVVSVALLVVGTLSIGTSEGMSL